METKGKEKVTLDLCSVCWHTCGSAYPYGCFHDVEQQPDLAVKRSQSNVVLLTTQRS